MDSEDDPDLKRVLAASAAHVDPNKEEEDFLQAIHNSSLTQEEKDDVEAMGLDPLVNQALEQERMAASALYMVYLTSHPENPIEHIPT